MADPAELQARIAALSGRINKRKNEHAPTGTGNGRWSPYAPKQTFQNRTLVMSNGNKKAEGLQNQGVVDFVKKVGRNNQLMSRATYEREQISREEQGKQGGTTPKSMAAKSQTPGVEVRPLPTGNAFLINGIRFEVRNSGSKLVRLGSEDDAKVETPKRVVISNVDFLRTKKGNLAKARVGNRYETTPFYSTTVELMVASHPSKPSRHLRVQCKTFTKLGSCPYGPSCRFNHNPNEVAICKDFFHTGFCTNGDNCDLSHTATYHRVPACMHFLRGSCTSNDCRYAHVHDVPSAPSTPVCHAFATVGYCSKGGECKHRHVHECPDYSNRGVCAAHEKGSCPLPHIDRASTIRRHNKTGSAVESDVSDEEEEGTVQFDEATVDATDSDGFEEEVLVRGVDDQHALVEQHDFVALA